MSLPALMRDRHGTFGRSVPMYQGHGIGDPTAKYMLAAESCPAEPG